MFRFFRAFKKIENIIILIAAVTFISTIIFKLRATKLFEALDLNLIEIAVNPTPETFQKIEKICNAFFYFDENLLQQFNDLYIQNTVIKLTQFQNSIHKKESIIYFGYDSLIYFSIILLTISFAIIIIKKRIENEKIMHLIEFNEYQKTISRNLHDGVAQDLVASKTFFKQGELDKVLYYIELGLKELRFSIDFLQMDYGDNFETLIKKILLTFEMNHEIKTTVVITSDFLSRLNNQSKGEILFILKEALSNIVRHSNATDVAVRITDVADEMFFSISDNGIGFIENDVNTKENKQNNHYGLDNIVHRVQKLKGSVNFINNGGTTIAIKIKNPVY